MPRQILKCGAAWLCNRSGRSGAAGVQSLQERVRRAISTPAGMPMVRALLAMALVAAVSSNVHAGPPSFGRSHGGGGFNWAGTANRAINSIQSARRMQQSHYPQRHASPSYQFSRPHTRSHSVAPQPRIVYPQHNYVHPRTTYVPRNSTPHTNVVPRTRSLPHVHVAPRTNVAPRTHAAPRTNVVPRATVTTTASVAPRPNALPQRPAAAVAATTVASAPRSNSLPAARGSGAARDAAPAAQAVPANPNDSFEDAIAGLTEADIAEIASQLTNRDLAQLNGARQEALTGLDEVIDNLPGANQLTPEDRQRIRVAVESGNPDAVSALLTQEQLDSPQGQDLVNRAAGVQFIDDILAEFDDRRLDGGEVGDLVNAAQGLPAPFQDDMLDLLAQMVIDQQVLAWLDGTQPGLVDVPFGPDVPIALVPGLPDGLLIPLDGGAVMMGMGAPGDEILLGTGNPAEVAGFPVALPDAEPVADYAGAPTAGTIILGNAGQETVNYNVNQLPQNLPPRYEQTLATGSTWLIEFDRGGGNGLARYTLSDGYYEFRPTERGWELFRQSFTATLENSANDFTFNYVIDDQHQELIAGQSHELTGAYPPVIRFNNGAGQELTKRLGSGRYKVALGPDQTFDVYIADSVSSPAAPSPAAASPSDSRIATSADNAAAASLAAGLSSSAADDAPIARDAALQPPAPSSLLSLAAKVGQRSTKRLPPGFHIFDPVEVMQDAKQARRLPRQFTLFRSAAESLAQTAQRN